MKKATLTLMILCALCGFTFAGPEPLPSGKEMKQVAPVPPACPNWAGFYLGGFGGYKFAPIDVETDLTGSWDTGYPQGRDVVQPRASEDLDLDGAELGGLIGFNYQLNKLVLGLEASGGYLWLRDFHKTGIFGVPGQNDHYEVSTSFKTHYLLTVGPRVGYAFCRWLPYVTGGLAVGDLDFYQKIYNIDFYPGVQHFRQIGDVDETHAGWMAGAGLEYALTDHWRIRGQYQYVDLGSVDFKTIGIPEPFTSYGGRHEAELTEHNVSFAIIYGF